MWSYNNRGEGINLAHNFTKGEDYCIDGVFNLDTNTGGSASANARARAYLT